MNQPQPIYTAENCRFSGPLEWGLSVFWRAPCCDDSWLGQLTEDCEPDGIRILGHRFDKDNVSQFSISTKPHVAPRTIVQRTKGRLQHLIRALVSKPFKRNYAIRSIGRATRETVEAYVSSQLNHHQMADERVQKRMDEYQVHCDQIDLAKHQTTSHGIYWYNLHLVLVHRQRMTEIRDSVLRGLRNMVVQASTAKKYLLSKAGILADHVHLVLGCPFESSPMEVALGFLNNLAYAQGMKPVYQYGGYVGTVGEYTSRAVDLDVSTDRSKSGRGHK